MVKEYNTKNQDSIFVRLFGTDIFSPHRPGEGDENDVCVGVVSGPGGAEPQRSLEAPRHLCLQHRASPLGGGTWTRLKGRDIGHSWDHLRILQPVVYHLKREEETVFAHCIVSPRGFLCICKYSSGQNYS